MRASRNYITFQQTHTYIEKETPAQPQQHRQILLRLVWVRPSAFPMAFCFFTVCRQSVCGNKALCLKHGAHFSMTKHQNQVEQFSVHSVLCCCCPVPPGLSSSQTSWHFNNSYSLRETVRKSSSASPSNHWNTVNWLQIHFCKSVLSFLLLPSDRNLFSINMDPV